MPDQVVDSAQRGSKRKSPQPISWPICVAVFFAGNILLWSDRTNFSVAAAAWARDYHWSPSTIGLMLSAFSLGYLIAQPFGGWFADRVGPRRTFSISMAGWSLWVILTPLAPMILWLTAVFRVFLGISETPYIPSVVDAVARAVPSEARRGSFSAIMQSGAQLGPAAGVFFAGLVLNLTGSPSDIFFLFGGFGLLFAGAWWLYARKYGDPAPSPEQAQTAEATQRASQALVSEMKLLTSRRLWPLYIGYFALPYCQYIFLAWLPQYLAHYRHMSIAHASFLSAFPFLVAFVAAIVAGLLMDWFASMGWRKGAFHRKSLIALGAVMYICATLTAANTSSTMFAVDMIMVANAGLAFYVYPFWTMVADMTPRQGGTLSGFMNFFGILGATISPYLSGVIAEATGAFVAPLELAAAIMLVAAITAIVFLRVRPLSEMIA
jgi:MFS transporter, ACS family, hexuronate transporter